MKTIKVRSFLAVLILTFLTSFAFAAQTNCPQHYLDGQAPNILNEKLSNKAQEVCYTKFGLLHSGISRTPIYSAEHLTKEALTVEHPIRKDDFHPDPKINPIDRAELADYKVAHSDYDRGHMAPSADMPDEQSQHECFTLANMVPQNPDNNRKLWEGIESAIRDFAIKSGDLFVVSGPIFYGSDMKKINGRVFVPTYLFKAIYDPQKKQAAAYFVANAAKGRYAVITIADLEKLSGLSVFPTLPDDVKKSAMDLPQPKPRGVEAIKDKTIVPQKPGS